MKVSNWYFYVVLCNDDTLYAGVTTDMSRRLHEHNNNSNGAKYTRARRPVKLVYKERFQNRSMAQKAEYNFKKLTRKQKEGVIKGIILEEVCDEGR